MRVRKRTLGSAAIVGVGFLLVVAGSALTAANAVPDSGAGDSNAGISADSLKPSACAALTLTTLVTGNNGTNGADLMTGSAGADNMTARNGNDCLLGGGGNDSLDGGGGTDVCIGGSGTNTFTACETRL